MNNYLKWDDLDFSDEKRYKVTNSRNEEYELTCYSVKDDYQMIGLKKNNYYCKLPQEMKNLFDDLHFILVESE